MPAVSKACDACRVRRTKCDGGQPCRRCGTSDIACSYDLHRRKRGPKGRTVTLLQDVLGSTSSGRTTPRTSSAPGSCAVPPPSSAHIIPMADDTHANDWVQSLLSTPAAHSDPCTTVARAPSPASIFPQLDWLLSPGVARPFGQTFHAKAPMLELIEDVLTSSVRDYFSYMHTLWPIVDAKAVQTRFAHKEHLHNPGFAAMLLSMAAVQMFLPHATKAITPGESSRRRAETLLAEAMALHNTPDLGVSPTLDAIATTLIMASALRLTRGFGAYYVKSREAISLAELLNMSDPQAYDKFSSEEKAVAVQIFWLLGSSERSNALLHPRLGDTLTFLPRPAPALRGRLTHLAGINAAPALAPCTRLFEAVDGGMVECISGSCNPLDCRLKHSGAQAALDIHQTLDEVQLNASVSPVQIADALVTRLWLHTEVWRGCMTHSLLQAGPGARPELSVAYPVEMLAQAVGVMQSLPSEAVRGNGRTIGNKIIALASTAETVLYLPSPPVFAGVSTVQEGLDMVAQLKELADELIDHQQFIRWEDATPRPQPAPTATQAI